MAKKGKNVLTDKQIREILKPRLYAVMKGLSEVSKFAIDNFYSDYEPWVYRRVYGLKNLFTISKKEIPKGYLLTYEYNADNIFNKPHHGDYEWAFDTAFIHGMHGEPRGFAPVPVSKPPWNIITEFVKNL